ncbi:hypothetical protein KSI01_27710 [Kurthia sibirica]|nr:hypothetical protein KSI01_27710 [Kurthia sibirica]
MFLCQKELEHLKSKNGLKKVENIIIKDLTISDMEKFGAKVTKTIIAELQPMHVFEPKINYSERLMNYGGYSWK